MCINDVIFFQKKYKDEAVKMLCTYSAVPNTPEIERIKNAQRNISAVSRSNYNRHILQYVALN